MRGTVEGLASPHPLEAGLPAVLRDDTFAAGLCRALDEVLAPVLLSLDGFAAHLDPALAPDDVLPWLAGWVGLDPAAPEPARRRAELLAAAEANTLDGTRRGLELVLRSALGSSITVTVSETGAATWSQDPVDALPGEPGPAVVVTVRVPRDQQVDAHHVDALVRGCVPAHVRRSVVIEQGEPSGEVVP